MIGSVSQDDDDWLQPACSVRQAETPYHMYLTYIMSVNAAEVLYGDSCVTPSVCQ